MGSVIANLIKETTSKHPIIFWDTVPGKVPEQKLLADIIPGAMVVFLCVPSFAVREAAQAIKSYLTKKTVVITIAKGIEQKTNLTMDKVMKEVLRGRVSGLLSGPMLADELKAGRGGAAVLALSSKQSFKPVTSLFVKSPLKLETSTATTAVAMAGNLKNIYAIVLGAAEGLEWGNNRKGLLLAEVVREMIYIFKRLHLPEEIILGTAGLGDLAATGFSSTSRNHQVGLKLVLNERGKSEGTRALPIVIKMLRSNDKKNVPLLFALNNVFNNRKTIKQLLDTIIA